MKNFTTTATMTRTTTEDGQILIRDFGSGELKRGYDLLPQLTIKKKPRFEIKCVTFGK